jgi:hypothetical protein
MIDTICPDIVECYVHDIKALNGGMVLVHKGTYSPMIIEVNAMRLIVVYTPDHSDTELMCVVTSFQRAGWRNVGFASVIDLPVTGDFVYVLNPTIEIRRLIGFDNIILNTLSLDDL